MLAQSRVGSSAGDGSEHPRLLERVRAGVPETPNLDAGPPGARRPREPDVRTPIGSHQRRVQAAPSRANVGSHRAGVNADFVRPLRASRGSATVTAIGGEATMPNQWQIFQHSDSAFTWRLVDEFCAIIAAGGPFA